MSATIAKSLGEWTAADLMSDLLLVIPRQTTMHEAAHLLLAYQVTGAPVVDEKGVCVGVLSATDFVHWVDDRAVGAAGHLGEAAASPHRKNPDQAEDAKCIVARYMTGDPVLVPPDIPLTDLAALMLDLHIHRVVVVDQENRPAGIVTTIDILGALCRECSPPHFTRRGEEASDLSRFVLRAARASELMTPGPFMLPEGTPAREALALFASNGLIVAPVVDEAARPVGLLGQLDIIADGQKEPRGRPESGRAGHRRVGDLMSRTVPSIRADATSAEVMRELLARNAHRLFVVDDHGVLLGVITATDVIRHLQPIPGVS